MGYFVFLVLAFSILFVLVLELGVLICGVFERTRSKRDGDSVHSVGVSNSSDSHLGERDEAEHYRQVYRIDKETAVIALKIIKHDLHHMLSDTEHRAIDFAIDLIRKGEDDDSLE